MQALTSAVQALFGAGNGGTLPDGPLLWSLLAFARSEFERITGTGGAGTGVVASDTLTTSPNLLVNPGAEFGESSYAGNATVSIPGWTVTGNPTVIEYGTLKSSWPTGLSFATPNLWHAVSYPTAKQAPPDSGDQFFGGGNVTSSTITQTVDLSGASADIDGGGVSFNLSGYLGGYLLDPSNASVQVTFLDQNNTYLSNASIGPVTNLQRFGFTGFKQRTTTGIIPEGARSAQVTVSFNDLNPVYLGFTARYNNAYVDNLSLPLALT